MRNGRASVVRRATFHFVPRSELRLQRSVSRGSSEGSCAEPDWWCPTCGGRYARVAGTRSHPRCGGSSLRWQGADRLSCNNQGTFDVAQAGAGFSATATQTGYCTGPGGVVDNSGTGSVSGFTSATTIQFNLAGCRYRGSLFATPPDSAAGSVSCSLTENNKTFTLTGTWFAVKGVALAPPTAAGTVTPPQGDVLFVPSDTFLV